MTKESISPRSGPTCWICLYIYILCFKMLYMKKVLQPDINQIKQQRHSGDIASHHSLKTKLLPCSVQRKTFAANFYNCCGIHAPIPERQKVLLWEWRTTHGPAPKLPPRCQHNATEAAGALEAPNGEAPELKHRAPTQGKREVWAWSFSLGFKARQSAAHISETFMGLHYILDVQILLMLLQSLLLWLPTARAHHEGDRLGCATKKHSGTSFRHNCWTEGLQWSPWGLR